MKKLETFEWWPELVALKDDLSLRELGEKFGVTPGAIMNALRRNGIERKPAPPGPRNARKKRRKVADGVRVLPVVMQDTATAVKLVGQLTDGSLQWKAPRMQPVPIRREPFSAYEVRIEDENGPITQGVLLAPNLMAAIGDAQKLLDTPNNGIAVQVNYIGPILGRGG